jgi:hypothetical protein
MDWGALGSHDAVLAICEHFGIDFAHREPSTGEVSISSTSHCWEGPAVSSLWYRSYFGTNSAGD